jgi:hypothetical protein
MPTIHEGALRRKDDWILEIRLEDTTGMLGHSTTRGERRRPEPTILVKLHNLIYRNLPYRQFACQIPQALHKPHEVASGCEA